MKIREPFFKYCCAISACLPQTTILCHSVRFCRSPALSLYVSSVATEKLATAWPPPVYRVSGSRPSRPTRITLFTDMKTPPVRMPTITRDEQKVKSSTIGRIRKHKKEEHRTHGGVRCRWWAVRGSI